MPIFLLPFALGGLALTALGLGVKRILEELPSQPAFPQGTPGWEAWARHRQALEALRLSRQRARDRARAYGERQAVSLREAVEPFQALLERLERWEHASAAEVLTPSGAEALSALPIRDRKLDALRSSLIAAAFEVPKLEQERVRTILGKTGPIGGFDSNVGTNGLAFSFLRGNADSERAKRDLTAVISALASRPELDAALAQVTERLKASPDEAMFAEQRRLRAAREEADRALAALAEGAEG